MSRKTATKFVRGALTVVVLTAGAFGVNTPGVQAVAPGCHGSAVVRCMDLHTSNGWYWATASIWDNGSDNVDYAVAIRSINGEADYDGWFGFHPVVDEAAPFHPWGCAGLESRPYKVSIPVDFAWVGPSGQVVQQTERVEGWVC